MSQDQKTQTPTLFNQPPAVCYNPTSNWFHVFNGITVNNQNTIRLTWFSGFVWGHTQVVGPQGLTNAPAPITNAQIKTIVAGGQTYVIYQSSAIQLSGAITTITSATALTTITTFTQLSAFELFTDGTSLYVLVVDGGVLKYTRWSGQAWDTPTVLTGSSGLCTSAPAPVSDAKLTAVFYQGQLRIVYNSSAEVAELTRSNNVWSSATVTTGSTGNFKCLRYFEQKGLLWLADVTGQGSIDVLWWATSPTPGWQDSYMSDNNVPAAAGTLSVGVMSWGIFMCYTDSSGNLQIIWKMDGNWMNAQLTGSGSFLPAGLSATTSPTVCVYNNAVFNVCYITNNNQVNDVHWFFSWAQASLYPTPPTSALSMP